jgi:hypothetical protein
MLPDTGFRQSDEQEGNQMNEVLELQIKIANRLAREGKLVTVTVNGKLHHELIKLGYRAHHLDGQIVHLTREKIQ